MTSCAAASPVPMQDAYRDQLSRSFTRRGDPRAVAEATIRRLDEQLARARRLCEFGEYDWGAFIAKRAQIQQEQEQLRSEAAATPSADDEQWCHTQLLDLLAEWDAADDGQRSRLLAGLFESVEAEALPDRKIKLTAVPPGVWRRSFHIVVLERETGLEPATFCLEGRRSTN